MLRIILYILIFFLPLFSMAQEEVHQPDPKAEKAFKMGLNLWKQFDAEKAEKQLRKAIEIDSLYVDPYILMGEMKQEKGALNETVYYFEKAISIDSLFSPVLYQMFRLVS